MMRFLESSGHGYYVLLICIMSAVLNCIPLRIVIVFFFLVASKLSWL